MQDAKEKLGTQGAVPLPMTPAEIGKFLLAEKERWAKVVKQSGFKME